jgi:adenylate kinase family enzyme
VKRVALVGSPGAGKTTFAGELASITGLPQYHLDELHWRPGWIEMPRDEFRPLLTELVANEEWIIDGNYYNTYDIRFARADTVINLALPRRTCLFRVLWRVATNWHRDVQAPGCPERFDWSFFLWVWRFPRDVKPGLTEALARHASAIELIELTAPQQVRDYISALRTSS